MSEILMAILAIILSPIALLCAVFSAALVVAAFKAVFARKKKII